MGTPGRRCPVQPQSPCLSSLPVSGLALPLPLPWVCPEPCHRHRPGGGVRPEPGTVRRPAWWRVCAPSRLRPVAWIREWAVCGAFRCEAHVRSKTRLRDGPLLSSLPALGSESKPRRNRRPPPLLLTALGSASRVAGEAAGGNRGQPDCPLLSAAPGPRPGRPARPMSAPCLWGFSEAASERVPTCTWAPVPRCLRSDHLPQCPSFDCASSDL